MAAFLTIKDFRFENKVVLIRADLNVPMKDGVVTDVTRLERILPTLKELSRLGARIVLLSHFGRPKGVVDSTLSLKPVAGRLAQLWGRPVAFAEDCIGPVARKAVDAMAAGQILVLENTRFHLGEKKNDPAFARELASLGDIFINDAFSVAHRAHASTVGVAEILPAGAGFLMQAELDAFNRALERPDRPLMAVVGGAKISTKLDLLRNLIGKVDTLVLGGGMANTFMAAKGIAIGHSLYELEMLETARSIMAEAEARKCYILLPQDVVVAAELKEGVATQTVLADGIPQDLKIFDVGPKTIAEIKGKLALTKTVVWNGPLGVFEVPPFDKGTNAVAEAIALLTQQGNLLSVAGGGDTVSAVNHAGVTEKLSYLSAAGGAFLEWLEGKELPGVAVLEAAAKQRKSA